MLGHVASVIDQGVDPGAGHGLAEERVGHPLAPHKDADEEMRQKRSTPPMSVP